MGKGERAKKSHFFRFFVDKTVNTKDNSIGKAVSTYLVDFISSDGRKLAQVVTPPWKGILSHGLPRSLL